MTPASYSARVRSELVDVETCTCEARSRLVIRASSCRIRIMAQSVASMTAIIALIRTSSEIDQISPNGWYHFCDGGHRLSDQGGRGRARRSRTLAAAQRGRV